MGVLSQITSATLELADEIIDKLYSIDESKPVLHYKDFASINLTRSKYYEILDDGLHVKFGSNQFVVSPRQMEYIIDCYINKGFNTAKEMGQRENVLDYQESKAYTKLRGFAEHSLVHIFETMKQSYLSCQRIQRTDLDNIKPEIESISAKTCLLHDLGMTNGLQYSKTGFEDTAKLYRNAHSALSGYSILSDMKSMFDTDRELYISALAAAAHSKSNSGLISLDEETRDAFIQKFIDRCNDWDERRGLEEPTFKLTFDEAKKLLDDNLDLFKEVSRVVALADSCTHSRYTTDTVYSQERGTFEIFKTEESSRGFDGTAFDTSRGNKDEGRYAPIDVIQGNEPLEYLKGLDKEHVLDVSGFEDKNEAFYVVYTDEHGQKELIEPNEFIIGERFCSFQEKYYNESGSLFELRIGNINPKVPMAEEGVTNYLAERVGEMWRYYTGNDMEVKVEIKCNTQDFELWNDIIKAKITELNEKDDRNNEIVFLVNGEPVDD